MQTAKAIRNYDADDFVYLAAKGWSEIEILTRWNEEARSGQGPCSWDSPAARAKWVAVTKRR